jgi:hypothetical protein
VSVRSGAASYALPSPVPRPSQLTTRVAVGAGARLHWRPEPLVSVAGSEHGMDTDVALAAGAALVWWDELVLGRFGEPGGRLRTRLRVDRAGTPLVRHQLDLGPGAPGWDGPGAHGPGRVVIEVVVVDAPGGHDDEGAAVAGAGRAASRGRSFGDRGAAATAIPLVAGVTNVADVAEAEVFDDLATAGVVYIGEAHTVARHHAVQLDVLQKLFLRKIPLVLCLEQLEARDQPAVDRFNRRELDFDTLAREIDWPKKWANHADYRALCEFARQHRIPVRALNAPAATIRAATIV